MRIKPGLSALALTAALLVPAAAQRGGPPGGGPPLDTAAALQQLGTTLQLSSDQLEKLRAVVAAHQQALQAQGPGGAPPIGPGGRGGRGAADAQFRTSFLAVLTPEQAAKLNAIEQSAAPVAAVASLGLLPAVNGRGGRGGLNGANGRGGRGGGNLGAVAVPAADPLTPGKIALGKQLFFDTSLSSDRTVACASCHQPALGYSDGRALAVGVNAAVGPRKTPSLINVGSGRSYFWDGRAATLEEQALQPITNPLEMGLTVDQIEGRTGHSATEVTAALASYVRTLRSGTSRYDWYLAGQTSMLTPEEQAGLALFRGRAQCALCHGGPNLSDGAFHNTGVGWHDGVMVDEGRFAVTRAPRDHGAFKTPTLRNVAQTGPYMHDGSIQTLAEVVDFYAAGGRVNPYLDPRVHPLRLSAEDKKNLAAFLQALTGPVTDGIN